MGHKILAFILAFISGLAHVRLGDIALWVWQFPQNLLGWLIGVFAVWEDSTPSVEEGGRLYDWAKIRTTENFQNGLSLGKYGYINPGGGIVGITGHCIQSLILGPFYLICIGLPSFLWAWIYVKWLSGLYEYTDFVTEAWAQHLGERYFARNKGKEETQETAENGE